MVHGHFLVNRFILTLSVFFLLSDQEHPLSTWPFYRVNDFFGKNDIYS